ncbi:hypothetical protein FNF31_03733 [Cafeteria roenbergensis]|uniref:Uncharacterized protein n=1 Tax=Cafeteria roenbergensis TaxID=33653 RepID=A0A5A8E616_CAFRO|nr:hypothetical protein FNF31_03733 [Cafeteria roenbergensis]KAA0171520.1 hypothetical protein FNF28_00730 [Cafeteria roenbergensis]
MDGPSVELAVSVPRRLLASDERGWMLALVWRACGQRGASASQTLPLQCVVGGGATSQHAALAEGSVVVDVPAEVLGLWSGSALQACLAEVWLLFIPEEAGEAHPCAASGSAGTAPDGVLLAQARVDAWWFAGAALDPSAAGWKQAQATAPGLARAWDAASWASGGALAGPPADAAPLFSSVVARIGLRVAGMVPSPWAERVETLGGGLSAAVPWWARAPSGPPGEQEPPRALVTMPGGTTALQCETVWTRPGPEEQRWRVELRLRPDRRRPACPHNHAAALVVMLGAFLWRLSATEGHLCRARVPVEGDSDSGPSAAALAAADLDDALALLASSGGSASWDDRLQAVLTACGASSWYCA